ncbi:hypothetical protein niasHT_024489 [Heterodera trifolii]|uniref:FHA domain-containing protein n=1 Tax=Heterodera trifolii TaxID=157864 RepID=A0ABD2K773_9BILA
MLKQNGGGESAILLPRQPNSSTLIGSSDECDIVIKSPGLRPKHAVIEFYPKTKSFWLRQLDPKNEQHQQQQKRRMESVPPPPPYPYEDTVGPQNLTDNTRQQVLRDGSLIELHPMDTLRFGKGANAVEFVFKMPPLHHKTRFDPFVVAHPPPVRKKCSLDREDISLPIVGSRIQPKAHADRFVRPKQQLNHRLCQLGGHQPQKQSQNVQQQQLANGVALMRRSVSACRLISVADSPTNNSLPRVDTPWKTEANGGMKSPNGYADSSCASSVDSDEVARGVAAGHSKEQLLRRVRRLQAELSRRDAEFAQLRELIKANGESGTARAEKGEGRRDSVATNGEWDGQTSQKSGGTQTAAADIIDDQKQMDMMDLHLPSRDEAGGGAKRFLSPGRAVPTEQTPAQAILSTRATDIFFMVCAEELNTLNIRISHLPARDYSDIFSEISKLLHEPFSFRLMEINSKCAVVFESLGLIPTEKEEIYLQFDQFLKEKIYPISKAIDAFLGTLRECAQMARDSARACAIFSQWSREFGDQLQLQPNWELMFYKVQDLQSRFRENGLTKHWLPPSLSPLLQVLIFEHRNRMEEQKRQQREATDALAEATRKIAELEKELENASDGTQKEQKTLQQQQIAAQQLLPRIELPLMNTFDRKGPTSLRSQRSSRASSRCSSARRRLQLGITDDEDSENSREAHIDSPQTPPPSVGGAMQRNIGEQHRKRRRKRSKQNEDEEKEGTEEEEKPWGDKKEEGIGKMEKILSEGKENWEQADQNGSKSADQQNAAVASPPDSASSSNDDGEEKARLAMCQLDSVYSKLEEQRECQRGKETEENGEEEYRFWWEVKGEENDEEKEEEGMEEAVETARETNKKEGEESGERGKEREENEKEEEKSEEEVRVQAEENGGEGMDENEREREEEQHFAWIEHMVKKEGGREEERSTEENKAGDKAQSEDRDEAKPSDGAKDEDGDEAQPDETHLSVTGSQRNEAGDEGEGSEVQRDEAGDEGHAIGAGDEAEDEIHPDESQITTDDFEKQHMPDAREEDEPEKEDGEEEIYPEEAVEEEEEEEQQYHPTEHMDKAMEKTHPDETAEEEEEGHPPEEIMDNQGREEAEAHPDETIIGEDKEEDKENEKHRDEAILRMDGEEEEEKQHPDEAIMGKDVKGDEEKQHPEEAILEGDGEEKAGQMEETEKEEAHPPDEAEIKQEGEAHSDKSAHQREEEEEEDEENEKHPDEAVFWKNEENEKHPDEAVFWQNEENETDEAAIDEDGTNKSHYPPMAQHDEPGKVPEKIAKLSEENANEGEAEAAEEEEEEAAARVLQQQWRKRKGGQKSAEKYGGQSETEQKNIVEFWELVRNLANLLEIELPIRGRVVPLRPESAGEQTARQTAMDSILDRLKTMLYELRRKAEENAKESEPPTIERSN